MIEFRMPSLGADMEAGTLCEWMVKPGDTVKRGDIVATVDTQKGLIDIEVFEEGRIEKLLIREDEKVPVGTVMALIEDGKGVTVPVAGSIPEKTEIIAPAIEKKFGAELPYRIKASPLAKEIAEEMGLDLSTVKGTGEEGAITKEDVLKAVAERTSPAEERKGASTGSIRMAVAAAMSKSNREIPHYYLETKVDMSKAMAWLTAANTKRLVKERLLSVVLYMKATAKALAENPDLNGHWVNGFQAKKEINMGFVVSLRTGGVMIPAIHDAGGKTIDELMTSLNDVIPRARALKLRSSDLSETTITITSLGEGSVETVYGVIYPPQVAIVGFGSISEQPWTENGMLDVRPVMNVTLAADHRATDGATGSRFLTALKNHLQKPELL